MAQGQGQGEGEGAAVDGRVSLRWMWLLRRAVGGWLRRGVALVFVVLVVAAGCSGSDSSVPPPVEGGGVSTTVEGGGASTSLVVWPGDGEVLALWGEVLAVFGAAPEERGLLADGLVGRAPVEEIVGLADLHFVLGEAVVLSSHAVLTPNADGSVSIVDCADSSGPSSLGPTTAGFLATAVSGDGGGVVLRGVETFVNCVRKDVAEKLFADYQLFSRSVSDFYDDPSLDNPLIDKYVTEEAAVRQRDFLVHLEERGELEGTTLKNQPEERTVEIISYLPDEIVVRDCRHGDETNGFFDRDGQRIDELEPPWRLQITSRMRLVDGDWLFDEVVVREAGDCLLGQGSTAHRPL